MGDRREHAANSTMQTAAAHGRGPDAEISRLLTESEQDFCVLGGGRVIGAACCVVAEPLGALLQIPDDPPGQRIEPMHQRQQPNQRAFPQIAAPIMRQFMPQNRHALRAGKTRPQFARHEHFSTSRPPHQHRSRVVGDSQRNCRCAGPLAQTFATRAPILPSVAHRSHRAGQSEDRQFPTRSV